MRSKSVAACISNCSAWYRCMYQHMVPNSPFWVLVQVLFRLTYTSSVQYAQTTLGALDHTELTCHVSSCRVCYLKSGNRCAIEVLGALRAECSFMAGSDVHKILD